MDKDTKIKTNNLEDIIEYLKDKSGDDFLRDGFGHMWKLDNNILYYKPQNINLFFEIKTEGHWFQCSIDNSYVVPLYQKPKY